MAHQRQDTYRMLEAASVQRISEYTGAIVVQKTEPAHRPSLEQGALKRRELNPYMPQR
jgi:hypothetical protein